MVETIQKIQDAGILVLSSIICGLESDTVQTIRTMRKFALESGSALAQFTFYHPYPGTKDYHEMIRDNQERTLPNFVARHKIRLREERFWLDAVNEVDVVDYPHISRHALLAENQKCWNAFYSVREAIKRTRRGLRANWSLTEKFVYVLFCVAFRRIYGG